MQSVYLETSVISYYANRPGRDLIIAARQQETREWWQNQKNHFEVFISQQVIDEAGDGDPDAAKNRLSAIEKIPLLQISDSARDLAQTLVSAGAIPEQFPEDAVHIAVATVHNIDYILTWNFKHINNAIRKIRIEKQICACGYSCPVICTPEELTEEE